MNQGSTRLLPWLLFLVVVTLGAAGAGKSEEKAWRAVEAAVPDPTRALVRAEEFLRAWPGSAWEARAHGIAADAALRGQQWERAREHGEDGLKVGAGDAVPELKLIIALAFVGEGRNDDAVVALGNIVSGEQEPTRLGRAARALASHLGRLHRVGEALATMDQIAGRGRWDGEQDLELARTLAAPLDEQALAAAEGAARPKGGGGIAAFLLLERRKLLTEGVETESARRSFAIRYPTHTLLSLVPGGQAFATAPENVRNALGLLLPMTGKFSQPAELVRRGVELGLRAAANRGWSVPELVIGDTAGDPETAKTELRRLVEQERVVAIIGPMVNAEAEGVAPLADELGVPTLMLVQRPGLALGRASVWNDWVTTDEQMTALLDFVVGQLVITKFAVAYPEKQGAAEVVENFWSHAEERGGSVATVEPFSPDATDYRETARRISAAAYAGGVAERDRVLPFLPHRAKPQIAGLPATLKSGVDFQAIFVADSYKRVSMLAPGFLYEEINLGGHLPSKDRPPVVLLGGANFNHKDLLSRGGKYVNGAVLTDAFFPASPEPEVVAFVKDCLDTWKAEPSILEAVGWDLANLVAQALAEGAVGRRGLRTTIPTLVPKTRVAGALGFGPDGEMRHEMLVIRVLDGKFVQVWPEPIAVEAVPP